MSLSESKLKQISNYYLEDGWDGYNETKGVGTCYICHGFTKSRVKTSAFEIGCDCKYSPCSEWVEVLIANRRGHNANAKDGVLYLNTEK